MRLWSDQSVPLDTKYTKRGAGWPHLAVIVDNVLDTTRTYIGEGFYRDGSWPGGGRLGDAGEAGKEMALREATRHMEVVMVRPNIEHHMLGIIMGQGGESLGSTFWGQTELSCYDDSMHGIWGMSYKYNERAIVINERNLVRLWDIAYDGYVGGKDDTVVEWNNMDESKPHSAARFQNATGDVSQPYRGPSMMVMVFDHKHAAMDAGRLHAQFQEEFRPNWPSPIVYYDRGLAGDTEALPADYDNVHVVGVQEFRVFNRGIYRPVYDKYKDLMPNFYELHKIRKNAGLAAVENEAPTDSLAFQGSMRVLNAESGALIQEINGSGHHGPDFIGVASLRAGKGYKINSQPTIQRLV